MVEDFNILILLKCNRIISIIVIKRINIKLWKKLLIFQHSRYFQANLLLNIDINNHFQSLLTVFDILQ